MQRNGRLNSFHIIVRLPLQNLIVPVPRFVPQTLLPENERLFCRQTMENIIANKLS